MVDGEPNVTPPAPQGETPVEKLCRTCGGVKPWEEFYSRGGAKKSSQCKQCLRRKTTARYRADPAKGCAAQRAGRRALRLEMCAAYGGRCECCGETAWEFLTLDHVGGGGKRHQREAGGSIGILRELRRQGWPNQGFRLLCWNCNCGRGRCGVCPHVRPTGWRLAEAEASPPTPTEKLCRRCGRVKPLPDGFFRRGDAYHNYCKECCITHRRERWRMHRRGEVLLPGPTELNFFKRCGSCHLWKVAATEFNRAKPARVGRQGRQGWCKACARAFQLSRRERFQALARARFADLRAEVIAAYGTVCACCGEREPGFLTIDHVAGGGGKERRTAGMKGSLYGRVKREGFPRDRYQLLCYCCNGARGAYGYCPCHPCPALDRQGKVKG